MGKKETKRTHTYRKLSVGVIKGKINKLTKMISSGEISDPTTIYNSMLEIARDAYCRGWEQRVNESMAFNEMNALRQKIDFDSVLTEIDDRVNKNK